MWILSKQSRFEDCAIASGMGCSIAKTVPTQQAASSRPTKVALPENVRQLLRRQMGFTRFRCSPGEGRETPYSPQESAFQFPPTFHRVEAAVPTRARRAAERCPAGDWS